MVTGLEREKHLQTGYFLFQGLGWEPPSLLEAENKMYFQGKGLVGDSLHPLPPLPTPHPPALNVILGGGIKFFSDILTFIHGLSDSWIFSLLTEDTGLSLAHPGPCVNCKKASFWVRATTLASAWWDVVCVIWEKELSLLWERAGAWSQLPPLTPWARCPFTGPFPGRCPYKLTWSPAEDVGFIFEICHLANWCFAWALGSGPQPPSPPQTARVVWQGVL